MFRGRTNKNSDACGGRDSEEAQNSENNRQTDWLYIRLSPKTNFSLIHIVFSQLYSLVPLPVSLIRLPKIHCRKIRTLACFSCRLVVEISFYSKELLVGEIVIPEVVWVNRRGCSEESETVFSLILGAVIPGNVFSEICPRLLDIYGFFLLRSV